MEVFLNVLSLSGVVLGLILVWAFGVSLVKLKQMQKRCTEQSRGIFNGFESAIIQQKKKQRTGTAEAKVRYKANGTLRDGKSVYFESATLFTHPDKGTEVNVWYAPDNTLVFLASVEDRPMKRTEKYYIVMILIGAVMIAAGIAGAIATW